MAFKAIGDTEVPCYIGHAIINTISILSLAQETATGNLGQSLPLVVKALKPEVLQEAASAWSFSQNFETLLKSQGFILLICLQCGLWYLTAVLSIKPVAQTYILTSL